MLTILGFVMSVVTGVVLSRGSFAAGGILMLVASLFDALDGSVARVTNRVSKFGGFFDSTLDRLAEAFIYLGVLVYFVEQPDGREEAILTYLAMVGSLMVSYARARAEGAGYECKVGLFTRFERIVVFATGLLFSQVRIALWIIVIGSFMTVLYRVWHVWKQST
jgi:CDP-diacylglycerol--glycerol-3-phosphate 3-phosphatidyltransferase